MTQLKNIFSDIKRNTFIRNVSILASGSILGQLVVVATAPLLTRLYTVEAFGVLSVFTSICTIFALFSTGRYELAIVLPESEQKAIKLIKLILKIALVLSLFYLLTIFILRDVIGIHDPSKFLNPPTVYLSPLYVFAVAILSALTYWNQRKKAYKRITLANALSSISNTVISLTLGFLMINNGMVWGLVGSIIIVVLFYFIKDRGLIKKLHGVREVMDTAKEYSAFPRYMIFSDLSLNANQQLTPIMFASLYNSTIVGHYSLANRILRLPNIVITSSIANVFRNDAIDEIRIHNNCRDLYVSTLKKLFLISFPVYLFLFILSPFIFKFVFGSEWGLAGDFGRIISIFLFVEFIATPLNTLFYVRNKQRKLMILQTINLFFSILMIVIGAVIFQSPYFSLLLYSFNALLFNVLLLIYSYKLSKEHVQLFE